jgi:thiamine biosynthesis lipoprotein
VATSGKDRRRWTQGDKLHHHLIDPRTGQSAETDVLTATVVATTVMEAEAAAKAIFILGSQEGLAWIEADPNLAGLLVMDDGRVICSQFMQQYL